MQKIFNPDLPFIKENWSGNPLSKSGRFKNIEHPFLPQLKDVWKWQTSAKPFKEQKKKGYKTEVVKSTAFLESEQDGFCWLGHNTFLFRLGGKLLLTDPVFTSPSLLMKRFSELPFLPSKIKNVDYLLITHDHRDHLDTDSLKRLAKNNPSLKVLTGLNNSDAIQPCLPLATIQEAGWYQTFETTDELAITYMPTRHWCRRMLTDTNKRLWGAFVLKYKNTIIYFGGDSGYGSHFVEIKDLVGVIDYAFLGIGAYMPEWFMAASHTSPADALQAAADTGCKHFVPMHYGTFDLADEPMDMPLSETKRLYAENDFPFSLKTPFIGSAVFF